MRQPKQVHIFLYRQRNGEYEFAVFQRSDLECCWQGVCGGVEDEETIEEGARRELREEAGIVEELPLHPLQSTSFLPVGIFGEECCRAWGQDTILVPMYSFAMPFDGEVKLSDEHVAVKWLPFDQAHEHLYFDTQRTSLYELHQRLLREMLSTDCVENTK